DSIVRSASQWKLKEAHLYSVLKQIESSYNVDIVGLMSHERMAKDPKITMILKTGTAEKALSSLGVTGLVWRKHQNRGRVQVYTVAWDKNDLNASAIFLSP